MTLFILPLFLGPTELILILLVVLLLFGGRKIPELMRGLGRGVKEFKDSSKEDGKDGGSKKKEYPRAKAAVPVKTTSHYPGSQGSPARKTHRPARAKNHGKRRPPPESRQASGGHPAPGTQRTGRQAGSHPGNKSHVRNAQDIPDGIGNAGEAPEQRYRKRYGKRQREGQQPGTLLSGKQRTE